MIEPEIEIRYPRQWVDEYLQCGFPKAWLADFPELFKKERGVYDPGPLPRASTYSLADYALMYLLREQHGIESVTYYRLTVKNSEARETHHPVLRKWLGADRFEKLQQALWAGGVSSTQYTGEPDLFCWHPNTGEVFFAEAKGPGDTVKESQGKWFKICRETLPEVQILVYRVLPESVSAGIAP